MTIVPKYENIRAEECRALMPAQTAVEIVLKSDGVKISKVLGVNCDAVLLSAEGVSGEVRYSGRADFKAVFIDASGMLGTLTYYADFSDKIEDSSVTPVSQLQCRLSAAETQVVSFTADEIKVACVIEAHIKVCNIQQVPVLSGGEGFFLNQASLNTTIGSGSGKGICEVSEEFEVKGIVSKILMTEASVIITDCSAGVDSVSAEGEICVRVTYFTSGEDGAMDGIFKVLPFRHEIECKGALPQDKAAADAVIRALKVNALVDEERNSTALEITAEAEISVKTYSGLCINYIDDAFAPDCKLNMTFATVSCKTFVNSGNYKLNIENTASLDGDMMPVGNILATACNRVNIANIMAGEGSFTVEGIASATVIYGGMSGDAPAISSVNVEIPFSETFTLSAARMGDTVSVAAAVCEVSAKSRKGAEIEVAMMLKFRADLYTDEIMTALSEVEPGYCDMAGLSSISIYCPDEKEKLWDIAKQLSVAPETVMQFNPDLKFPAGAQTRVFVYRQKF